MRRALLVAALVILAGLLMIPAASFYYEAGNGENCTRCHEMRPVFETWRASAHTKIGCQECHGGGMTPDWKFHWNNAQRVQFHLAGNVADMPRRAARSVTVPRRPPGAPGRMPSRTRSSSSTKSTIASAN